MIWLLDFSSKNIDADKILHNGKTLLFEAVYYQDYDSIRILLSRGANPNFPIDHLGNNTTPLLYALENDYIGTEILLNDSRGTFKLLVQRFDFLYYPNIV
jgi:hypothetical protein